MRSKRRSRRSDASWRPRCRRAARGPLKALDDRAMELASRDAELRAALFRFVDVVPACRSLDDLARHLTGFLDEVDEPAAAARRGDAHGDSRAGRAALGAAAAAGVRHMAHRFIVGETPQDARGVLRALWRDGVAASVDLLGEATVTADEADRYAERCADALDDARRRSTRAGPRAAARADASGPMPRVNLSVKVSALTPLLRPDAPELGARDAAERLRPLLRRARELGAHLHIDMESLDSREAVTRARPRPARGGRVPRRAVGRRRRCRPTCATRPSCSTGSLAWAQRHAARASPLTVRLVKGAYWDHEIVEARQHGWARRCSRTRPTATATSRR